MGYAYFVLARRPNGDFVLAATPNGDFVLATTPKSDLLLAATRNRVPRKQGRRMRELAPSPRQHANGEEKAKSTRA
jgi:hypothetical protein